MLDLTRRQRHKYGAGTRAALFAQLVIALAVLTLVPAASANHPGPFLSPLAIPQERTSPDISITAEEADVPIFAGTPTRMWTYNGTFPGPTIRRPTGKLTRVAFTNNLPAAVGSLSFHNHGNHSSPENDGQPTTFLVAPGASRTYYYYGLEGGKNERGTMQWYHDHRDGVTGRNVWMGLAGLYIIDDPADPQTLPAGDQDVPLVLGDRSFDANNQLSYQLQSNGVTGDHILVNGVPQPFFEVADRKYRFRILNGSNIRNYQLELSNGQAMQQIGTESGLLPAPVSRQSILLSPAERVDVVVDFAGMLGQQIVLRNSLENGALSQLMQFRVTRDEIDTSSVPASLRPVENIGTPTVTRTFEFARAGGQWTINGQPFDPNRVDAQPVLGTTERWILRNAGGWDHTIHIHDVDHQLISRNGQPPTPDELTKESWYIGGGQEIEVKLKFTDNVGRYVFHCHVLEHEDDAMMGQFEVVPASGAPTPYPRPASATPVRVPLVPAYRECTTPNSTHVAPLDTPACGPPQLRSDFLTLGTAGAGSGFAKLRALVGNPGTPEDDADVAVSVSQTDVRNKSGGSDYTGELNTRLNLRITDQANGNSQVQSGTVSDLPLDVATPCAATGGSSGGACQANTTLDAMLPGTVREGALSVWQLQGVQVYDGGADGSAATEDNGLFAEQGLFAP
jgi:FtsP/CotA-like multicopper oxidase with cupredoxin domain